MSDYLENNEKLNLIVIPLTDSVAFPAIPMEINDPDAVTAEAADIAIKYYDGLAIALPLKPGVFTTKAYDEHIGNVKRRRGENDNTAPRFLPQHFNEVGTVVRVRRKPDTGSRAVYLMECLSRASVISLFPGEYGVLIASVASREISSDPTVPEAAECAAALRRIFSSVSAMLPQPLMAVEHAVYRILRPEAIADLVAAAMFSDYEDKLLILNEFDPYKRANAAIVILGSIGVKVQMDSDAGSNAESAGGNPAGQRRMGYNQEGPSDADEYAAKIAAADLPDEVRAKLSKEADKLNRTPFGSVEATVIMNYLDVVLEIPWKSYTHDKLNVDAAKKILDADHDGLEKVKNRILEFLAVKQLNPQLKNQIICLVGPPGTGKTSVAASVARAMNRRYVRVSLGGIHDEAEIRGHRKTYVASMPGRIITALTQAKVNNPLMLLDEIDKLTSDSRGDPASALLEALDPEQNKSFRDHFVEIPFDLSDVLFITTANSADTIPRPLLDRMEVIELPGYTRREKLSIAKNHLYPKQLKRHGLNKRMLKITEDALYEIIDCYTREAGVRNLERTVADLCRKAARKIVESHGEIKRIVIDKNDLPAYLGPRKLNPDRISGEDLVGVVNGLAYTEAGGDLLKIEALALDGTGKLELTGSLGDVMKESAKTALTHVRSLAAEYGIPADFYKTRDIHIHVPEGAVPKDGPSAGVTMTSALISALTGIPAAHNVAMTGEVTLTGRVLAIGGLREKTMAAYAAGIDTVLIPEENLPDLEEIDPEVRANVKFIPCRNTRQVLENILFRSPKASE